MVWGIEGTKLLIEYANSNRNFTRFEAIEFCSKYYSGKSNEKYSQMHIFQTSLRLLEWKGMITEKRRRYTDYSHVRYRGYAKNRRKRDQDRTCAICGKSGIQLYTHHLFPITWGGLPDDENNIVTVCKTHHLELHIRLRKKLTNTLLIRYLEPYRSEILELVKKSLPDELKDMIPK
jgi:hypothetical protein